MLRHGQTSSQSWEQIFGNVDLLPCFWRRRRRWSCSKLFVSAGTTGRGEGQGPRVMAMCISTASGGSQSEPSPPQRRAALTWRGGSVPRGLRSSREARSPAFIKRSPHAEFQRAELLFSFIHTSLPRQTPKSSMCRCKHWMNIKTPANHGNLRQRLSS